MLHVLPFKSTAQSLWCSVIGAVKGDQLSTRLWGSVGEPDVQLLRTESLASDAMLTQALKTEGGKSRFLSIPFLHSDTDHLDPSLLTLSTRLKPSSHLLEGSNPPHRPDGAAKPSDLSAFSYPKMSLH